MFKNGKRIIVRCFLYLAKYYITDLNLQRNLMERLLIIFIRSGNTRIIRKE